MTDEVCEWEQTDEDSEWYHTDCGKAFIFNDNGPIDNGFIFCAYCGKKLKEVKWQSMTEV